MPHAIRDDREVMEYDVIIVGGGPSGLSCAIRLKQNNPELNVCLLEKGSEIGAHLVSGAVFETHALDELIPDWKEKGAPLSVKAKEDKFLFLTKTSAYKFPTPPQMHNKGNYIISLCELARWLAEQAEELGIEIFPGFAAAELLCNDQGEVIGVATGDMGIGKDGNKTDAFEAGVELHAPQTVFAEGCHGSLTKQLIAKFNLRDGKSPQTYGLGIKEVWEIDPAKHKEGHITHTIGWPMDNKTYGGSWIYHWKDNMVSIGFVVGLDYTNPTLSPFMEMQRFKTHPEIKSLLEGGKRIAYGARALVEGGLQSQPKLSFPGGVLVGDTAGFLNVPKIKGNHTAIKTGMLAADAISKALDEKKDYGQDITSYEDAYKASWVYKELYKARNIRPGFKWGLWAGLIHAAFQTVIGWMLPYTLQHHTDHDSLQNIKDCKPIEYPKPDGVLTFDRLTSVQLSNTGHDENQPAHLKLTDANIPVDKNLVIFGGPSQFYCPASVYEFVEETKGEPKFVINAQNCVHCKTCDIKDPSQNITWTVPQGGGGPNYSIM